MGGKAHVSRPEAEVVLREVRKRFAPYIDPEVEGSGPELVRDWDWSGHADWAIIWEGGPYEWAYLAASGGVDEELTELNATMAEYRSGKMKPVEVAPVEPPERVFLEPVTSWALGLYLK